MEGTVSGRVARGAAATLIRRLVSFRVRITQPPPPDTWVVLPGTGLMQTSMSPGISRNKAIDCQVPDSLRHWDIMA
jgi:hypothetical protein